MGMAACSICLLLAGVLLQLNVVAAFNMASFHIDKFDEGKMGNPEVLGLILETIQRYDIMLIQDIRDEMLAHELRSIINEQKVHRYGLRISEKVGPSNEESYFVFFFRKDTGIDLVANYHFDDTDYNMFERDPFAVKVRVERTMIKEFAIIALQVNKADVITEMNGLPVVVDAVMKKLKVNDVMIMGDMAADCGYIEKHPNEWEYLELRNDQQYVWLIGDEKDTTVSAETDCAYDRFIARGSKLTEAIVEGSGRIYNFTEEYKINQTQADAVSSHFPIIIDIKLEDGSVEPDMCGRPPDIDLLAAGHPGMKKAPSGEEVKETPGGEPEYDPGKEEL